MLWFSVLPIFSHLFPTLFHTSSTGPVFMFRLLILLVSISLMFTHCPSISLFFPSHLSLSPSFDYICCIPFFHSLTVLAMRNQRKTNMCKRYVSSECVCVRVYAWNLYLLPMSYTQISWIIGGILVTPILIKISFIFSYFGFSVSSVSQEIQRILDFSFPF